MKLLKRRQDPALARAQRVAAGKARYARIDDLDAAKLAWINARARGDFALNRHAIHI